MFLNKLVKICWSDPMTIGGKWVNIKDVENSRPMPIISYGVVVYEDDSLINIVAHLTNDGDVDGDICLPKSIIDSITELNEGAIHSFNHPPITAISTVR
jgi:hypothetical protein